MFTARPNVLRSAIAVALSSFVLPVSKAGDDIKVKLTGTSQSQGGREYIRQMTLKFGDQVTDKVVAQFVDEVNDANQLQFFSNHLKTHDSQFTVQTAQHGNNAASYTSTVEVNRNPIIALSHELTTGDLTLKVNRALLDDSGQPTKNLQQNLETAALDPVTGAATPETFKHLLRAIRETTPVLEDGEVLTEVAKFKITPIETKASPFLRQKLFDQSPTQLEPSTLLRGTAWIFPDPEQALAMMTTGLINTFVPGHLAPAALVEGSEQPGLELGNSAQIAITKLAEARPPVSAVMAEQTTRRQTTKIMPLNLPIIKLSKKAGELVLTADQVSPSAIAWAQTLSGTQAPVFDSVKIKVVDAPDLLEAVYQEQVKIIEFYKDLNGIPAGDIQRLSHLTKQAILISFVQTNGNDFSFSREMIETITSPLDGVGLFSRLLHQFAGYATILNKLSKAKFLQHLTKQLPEPAQPQMDESNRAVYFHDVQTAQQALRHCQKQHSQIFTKSQAATAYDAKLTTLSSEMQSYMDEEALTNYIPELAQEELTKILEDEDGYKKIQPLASKHHSADAPTLKKRWLATQQLAKQLRDQPVDQPEQKVEALVRDYSSLEKVIDESGIKTGEEESFKKTLGEMGLPPDQYADIVVKVIQDVPADEIQDTYKDVKTHLMEVDLETISDETIHIAQTGITIEAAGRIHKYEQSSPGALKAKRNSLEIRKWLASLKTPDDLPSEGALGLFADQSASSKPMHKRLQESWQILPEGSLASSTARQELSRKLLTFTTLMQHLAKEHDQAGLLNTIKANYPELMNLAGAHDPSVVITVPGLFEYKLAGLKLTDYKEQIQAVVTELGQHEFAALQDSYDKVLKPLHKGGLLAPEALELGLFELDQLEIARKAFQRQPAHLADARERLQNVKVIIQESNTELLHLVQKVVTKMVVPAPGQLHLLPRAHGYATLQETRAIKTFIENYADNEAFPKLQSENAFNIIRSFAALLSLIQGEQDQFITTNLAAEWNNLRPMLQANGDFAEDQEAPFKLKLTTLALDQDEPVNVQALAKLVSALNFADQATMVQIYNLYKTLTESTDVWGITAPKVLQVMMNLSAEDIVNCRLLHQSRPDHYGTLVDASAKMEKGIEDAKALAKILKVELELEGDDLFSQMKEKAAQLQNTLDKINQVLHQEQPGEAYTQLVQQQTELESKLKAVNDFFDGLDDQYFKSVKGKEKLTEKIQQFQHEIKTLQDSLTRLTEDFQGKSEELKKVNETLRTKTQEFDETLKKQELAKKELEDKASETENLIKQLRNSLKSEGTGEVPEDPVAALKELKTKAEAKAKEVEELTIKLKELEKKQVPASESEAEAEATALNRAKKELETKTQSLNELKEKIEQSVTNYGKTFQGTQDEQVAAMLEDAKLTKEQLERNVRDLQNAQAEIERLLPPVKTTPTPDLQDEPSVIERVKSMLEEFEEAKARAENLQTQVGAKTTEARNLKLELNNREDEIKLLVAKVETKAQELKHLDAFYDSANTEVNDLISKYQIPVDDNDSLALKVTKVSDHVVTLKKDLEAELLRAQAKSGPDAQPDPGLSLQLSQKNQELEKAQRTLTSLTTDFESLESRIGIDEPADTLPDRFNNIARRYTDKQQEVNELTSQLQQKTAIIEEIGTKLPPQAQPEGQPAATKSTSERVKDLVDNREQLVEGLKLANQQLLAFKQEAERVTGELKQKQLEAGTLKQDLTRLQTTSQQYEEIIKSVESQVATFEANHKCNPDDEKNLEARMTRMANYATAEIKGLETELGSVKRTLDTLVPDEPPAVATADARQQPAAPAQPKSTVEKIDILRQKHKELQTQVETLQNKVEILGKQPGADPDAAQNLATTMQKLSTATRERDQLITKLERAKNKLDAFETAHPPQQAIDKDDLEARAQYVVDTTDKYVLAIEQQAADIQSLGSIRDYYEVLKESKAAVPSAHLAEELPKQEVYEQIVPIAAKFNLLPPDQLAYAFNQIHLLVADIHAQENGNTIINSLQGNLPAVTDLFDPGTGAFNEPAYEHFLTNTGIPNDLDQVVRKVLFSVSAPLLQAFFEPAEAIYQTGIQQANPTSVSNWSLAKSQLAYDQLQTLREAGNKLADYDQIVSLMESTLWLSTVTDHLPDDATLNRLPATDQLPAYEDYLRLKEFVNRHMDVPETGIPKLIDKLEAFVNLVKVLPENTMINEDSFQNLKIAAGGTQSPEGDIAALAVKLNIPRLEAVLQKAVLEAADFREFDTLLTDATFLTPVVDKNHVSPESLIMVYRGYTPHTVRMTRLALRSAPGQCQVRRADLAAQAQFHQALKLVNTPEMSALLSDDDPADVFHKLMQPHSAGMAILQNVKTTFPGAGTEQPVAIHQGLLAISLLITGDDAVDDSIINRFKNAFTGVKAEFEDNGVITNLDSLRALLTDHKIEVYEKAALRIYSSPITEATFDNYVTHAKVIVKHFGKMISFATLQAVYQGWQPEQFAHVKILVERHPQLRDIARKTSPLSGMANLAEEARFLEQASTELKRISLQLAALDQDALERQMHLSKVMPGLQDRAKAVVLAKVHEGGDGDKGVNTALKKVRDANTLKEMNDAIEAFISNNQVDAAVDVHSQLVSLQEQFQEFPSQDEIAAMDNAALGPVHDAATVYNTDFVGNGIRRQKILEPVITPLTTSLEELSLQKITQTYRLLFPAETENPVEATTATPVFHPAIENCEIHQQIIQVYDFWQHPDPDQLGDMKAMVGVMATEDWQPKLQLWTGVTNNKEHSAPKKMQGAFNLARNTEDVNAFQKHLNSLFNPQVQSSRSILDSITLGDQLVDFVNKVEKLKPHVKAYEKFVASQGTKTALTDLAKLAFTHRESLQEPLKSAIPVKGEVPKSAKDIRDTVETILALKQELELLEDLDTTAKQLKSLLGEVSKELDAGDDYDPALAQKYKTDITEMDEFCTECQRGIVASRVGADHFKGLHTDGKLDQSKVQHVIIELDNEVRLAKAAQPEVQRILEGGAGSPGATLDSYGRIKPLTDALAETLLPDSVKAGPDALAITITAISALKKIHAIDPSAAIEVKKLMGQKELRLTSLTKAINTAKLTKDEFNALWDKRVVSDSYLQSLLDDGLTVTDLIASDDPVSKLKTSKKVVAKLKEERLRSITLQETLTILNELDNYSEREAALLMKKLLTEKPSLKLDEAPRSVEDLRAKITEAHGDEISEDNALRMARLIFHGTTITDNSWSQVSQVVAKLPDATPEMFAGATQQLINYTEELSDALLKMNTAFQKFFSSNPLVQKMVGAVHTYQISLEELETLRSYTPGKPLPKAANYLGMSKAEVALFTDRGVIPDEIWDPVVKHLAKNPDQFNKYYAVKQTGLNAINMGYRFLTEFILDDFNLYGGTGVMSLLTGYGDRFLELMGYSREDVARETVRLIQKRWSDPEFQKGMAQTIVPFTSGYQVYRVLDDIKSFMHSPDASAAQGAGWSLVFLALTWTNDLAWGAPLTKRMALAFRGFDRVVNIQMALERRIQRTKAQWRNGDISQEQMLKDVARDRDAIRALDEDGPDFQEKALAIVDTLKGDMEPEDIEYYKQHIENPFAYRNAKRSFEEKAAAIGNVLAPLRPVTNFFGSSLPKWWVARAVADPMVRYGINRVLIPAATKTAEVVAPSLVGRGVASAAYYAGRLLSGMAYYSGAKMAASGAGKLASGAAYYSGASWFVNTMPAWLTGTMTVSAIHTAYDCFYYNCEGTRQTWAETYNFFVGGSTQPVSDDQLRKQGVIPDAPSITTASYYSMSAPKNIWAALPDAVEDSIYSIAGWFGSKIDDYMGVGPRSLHSFEAMFTPDPDHRHVSSKIFGYAETNFIPVLEPYHYVYDHVYNHSRPTYFMDNEALFNSTDGSVNLELSPGELAAIKDKGLTSGNIPLKPMKPLKTLPPKVKTQEKPLSRSQVIGRHRTKH